jgi:hypothetical protein
MQVFGRMLYTSGSLVTLSVSLMAAPAHAGEATAGSPDQTNAATAQETPAGEWPLGGVDMQGYCRSRGYSRADLQGATAYDWRCVDISGRRDQISMTDACRWQYATTEVIDRVADFYNPYSWQCWGTSTPTWPAT